MYGEPDYRVAGTGDRDPLHSNTPPEANWTTANIGEAIPGVQTPLSWTLWAPISERATREATFAVGALSRAERRLPERMSERFTQVFYGRPAMQVEWLTLVGDRMPGTSGEDVARAIVGRVPEDITYRATRRRYPVVALRMPWAFATVPNRLRRAAVETDRWYGQKLPGVPRLDRQGAIEQFKEAAARLDRMVTLQATSLFVVINPLYAVLERLVERTGVGEVALLSGSGGAEVSGIVGDLWHASRGDLELSEFIDRHGFHGPLEGELSSHVWREDPSPLLQLQAEYAARDDSASPFLREREIEREREAAQEQLVAAMPRPQRSPVRVLLRMAATGIPLRGVAKRSFLQAFDLARASARRAGECMAFARDLERGDDVFYLTIEELTGELPAEARELVARRRELRARYVTLSLPVSWKGEPRPTPIPAASSSTAAAAHQVLQGVGVSPGICEGPARVLESPDFTEFEPGEILVAPTTDPSWSSVMFLSSGLVVDIGGPLSHAAVIARELGLPCVVNTRSGTGTIQTGDLLRIDGAEGTVEVTR